MSLKVCKKSIRSYPIVIRAVDVSRHSEVADFHQQAVAHQAVSCCQVTVDEVLRPQVDHPWCDLSGYMQHLRQTQFSVGLKRLTINQYHCVWTVSSVRNISYPKASLSNARLLKNTTLKWSYTNIHVSAMHIKVAENYSFPSSPTTSALRVCKITLCDAICIPASFLRPFHEIFSRCHYISSSFDETCYPL